jgi:AAA domain
MSLFQPAESTSAYLKMGMLGFAGSGKTKTAGLTAIGLVKYMQKLGVDYASRPVYFLDTETGSDWVVPDFNEVNIKLATAKTRAFADLLAAVPEAQANGSVLIIDSISHFWKELCETYQQKKADQFNRATYKLQFQDWGYLKGEWNKFTDMFVNSPLHIILCGRAGYEYDYFEEDGKKELEKTGVKMKAEGEMGYEPSLLVHMERRQLIESGSVARTWREATVLKDRSTQLDGKIFKFESTTENGDRLPLETLVRAAWAGFGPHIKCLNLGGRQLGVDTSRTSDSLIKLDRKDWTSMQREIWNERLANLLLQHFTASAEDKKKRIAAIEDCFGATMVEIEKVMRPEDIEAGYELLHQKLTGKPSRFALPPAPDMDDSLPDHSAPPLPATDARSAAA